MKSFLYLDEYKMYSISSQLFAGLTTEVTRSRATSRSDSTHQKGPLGSGNVLADLAQTSEHTSERSFLHDYAYTQFESQLETAKSIHLLDMNSPVPEPSLLLSTPFVKVAGRAFFNDVRATTEFMAQFNTFGQALTYVTTQKQRQEIVDGLEKAIAEAQTSKQKSALKQQLKETQKIATIAARLGHQQDPELLRNMLYLLTTTYGDHFELQIGGLFPEPSAIVTAILRREHLRENAALLVKRYSRETQMPLTVVGTITQIGRRVEPTDDPTTTETDQTDAASDNLRGALKGMARQLGKLELSLFSAADDEIIIDPIAVYREFGSSSASTMDDPDSNAQ